MTVNKPQTITEKIFSNHIGKKVFANDYVIADLDLVMAHDTTCAWAIDPFEKIADKVWDKEKVFVPFDHAFPAPNVKMASLQSKIRKFTKKQGIKITMDGVCHQLMVENFIYPGNLILGADSHTPTSGALGAITIGVGSTDAAIAMATGKCWFKVPETIRINIEGNLPKGIFAKDVVLMIANDLGPEGGIYKCIEYGGEVVRKFDLSSRLTLTNMAAELGAKAAIVEPDNITLKYIKDNRENNFFDENELKNLKSDKGCRYIKELTYDVSNLAPQIAKPHEIDNIANVETLMDQKIEIDQIFIGSCTNCRIEDLEITYDILKDNKLSQNIRLIITPASRKVWEEANKRGYLDYFSSIGATVTSPGCGACLGRLGGVLADNEKCISTSNRNFQGRMGSPNAGIYLASPATAAASAITGKITDPRKYL